MKGILVTGATGNIGREVAAQLRAAGLPVRAMSRNPQTISVEDGVEAVPGDLTKPESLDPALDDVGAVFLVWTAPLVFAAAAIERIASRAERIVLVSSPHRTAHPFFQQPNALRAVHAGLDYVLTGPQSLTQREQVAVIGASIGRQLTFDELSPEVARREMIALFEQLSPKTAPPETVARVTGNIADMLLSAYGAAVNRPALVTSTIEDVTGTPARTFREWAIEHASDFRGDVGHDM